MKDVYYPRGLHKAARAGDLSALKDVINRGEHVNSVDEVSWFVGLYVKLKL